MTTRSAATSNALPAQVDNNQNRGLNNDKGMSSGAASRNSGVNSEKGMVASRRRLLGGCVAGIAAAAIPGASAMSAAARNAGPLDVVVVGGGFAGTTAARELAQRGLNVVLLEARDRLGGRTYTRNFGNDLVEMGGTWVHWHQPFTWSEIMRYGLEIEDTQSAAPVRWMAGGVIHESSPIDYYTRFNSLCEQYYADADKIIARPYLDALAASSVKYDTMSAVDRLDQLNLSRVDHDLLEGILGTYFLGSPREGAYTELIHDWLDGGANTIEMADSASRWKLKTGTKSLIDHIAADGGYDVRLSTPVKQVVQDDQGVTVTPVKGAPLRARFVVIAVPVNTLANINFHPPLSPAKQAMARERHPGVGDKVWIRVRGRFEHVLTAPTSEPFTYIRPFTAPTDASTLLCGFGCGAPAVGFDYSDRSVIQSYLRKFVPNVEVLEVLTHSWTADPYSLGTHCMFKKGQWTRYLEGLRRPEKRLFFATGDIAVGWRGYIDGAIETGVTASQGIMAASKR